ncbi:MAG: sulfatase-like hydrolase/transferase, partial [Pseudomonadota bacterium]
LRRGRRVTNLLVIMADEMRPDMLGCLGKIPVETPHLDALADRGTLFTSAYTPSPICVPARAAFATGRPVHQTGHWDSAAPYDGAPRSWMHGLRHAGYTVWSVGKLHYRENADLGFSRMIAPMFVANDVGWPAALLRGTDTPNSGTGDLAREVGFGDTDYNRYDRTIADEAAGALAELVGGPDPFALFVSFVSPHYPLIAPEQYRDRYEPGRLPPPVPALAPGGKLHPEVARLRGFFDHGDHFSDAGVAEARAAYFALCTFIDDQVGRLVAALEESGAARDTLVLFVSDHGEMLGDHGLWTKQVMYEASVGIPMILSGPQVPKGQRVTTPVSLLDVCPTALDVAGLPPLGCDAVHGRSLRALAAGADDPDRTVFSEYHDGGGTTGQFMVRWADWKYIHYAGMRPQLFNLSRDADEQDDLSGDSTYASTLAEGEARLRRFCDPDAVNSAAHADQERRRAALGGVDAVRALGTFTYTPVGGSTAALSKTRHEVRS